MRSLTRRYADFRGRSGRKTFWTWGPIALAVWIGLALLDRRIAPPTAEDEAFGPAIGGALSWTFAAVTVIPCLALAVRRLHDVDRRGWWLVLPPVAGLIAFAMVVVWLLVGGTGVDRIVWGVLLTPVVTSGWVIALLCRAGTSGPNRFGPDPDDPAGALDLTEVFR